MFIIHYDTDAGGIGFHKLLVNENQLINWICNEYEPGGGMFCREYDRLGDYVGDIALYQSKQVSAIVRET